MSSLTDLLLNSQERHGKGRVGLVATVTSTSLTLLIGDSPVPSAYIDSYAPQIGDLVAVLWQDSTLVTIGRLAGAGENLVVNPSFEDGGENGGTPPSWFLAQLSGTATASTVDTGAAVSGTLELAVSSGAGASNTYVYSQPIPVTPGEQWALSGYTSAAYPSGAPTADAGLVALWFANDTNLYPTTAAADTVVATATDVGPLPTHASVSGTVTVPGAAAFMRVATRSTTAAADITMYWDLITCRRVA